jgi:hypothetical protein
MDTASSPSKSGDVNMTEAEKLAKRRLAFESTNIEKVGRQDNMAMSLDISPGAVPVVDNQEDGKVKKRQKGVDGTSVSGTSGSAASLEDDRRAQ